MNEQKLGIGRLVEMLAEVKNLLHSGAVVLEDGKIDLRDLGQLMPMFQATKAIVEDFPEAKAEVLDMDLTEAQTVIVALMDLVVGAYKEFAAAKVAAV